MAVNEFVLAHPLFGPLDGRIVVAGKGLDSIAVLAGTPAQHFLVDGLHAHDVAEEVDHPFGSCQRARQPWMTIRSKQRKQTQAGCRTAC